MMEAGKGDEDGGRDGRGMIMVVVERRQWRETKKT